MSLVFAGKTTCALSYKSGDLPFAVRDIFQATSNWLYDFYAPLRCVFFLCIKYACARFLRTFRTIKISVLDVFRYSINKEWIL